MASGVTVVVSFIIGVVIAAILDWLRLKWQSHRLIFETERTLAYVSRFE